MRKGDLCLINLFLGEGHEQLGKRPAIIISDTKTGIVVVIPLTTNLNALRFPYTIAIIPDRKNNLKQESVALIFYIRSIDKSRVLKKVGIINKDFQKKIDNILKEMMSL
ncbi:type II toxin-antitoxin system PemK/MazF family toxin [Patescibacteria group bacterium]|nr:type II toxin-antitoxin system PemK/MazF family toxin [Patescibacteria group bacterium]